MTISRSSVRYKSLVPAGVMLGLGMGGFFDGIVFHQILQWHHMLTSAGYPATDVANLKINTLWDGLFHAATYIFTIAGLFLLWNSLQGTNSHWPVRVLIGAVLMGWGIFNLIEGLVNHQLLGIHHVRDDLVSASAKVIWDLGFLIWGAIMLIIGWTIHRSKQEVRNG